jgi:hypothetical protein
MSMGDNERLYDIFIIMTASVVLLIQSGNENSSPCFWRGTANSDLLPTTECYCKMSLS